MTRACGGRHLDKAHSHGDKRRVVDYTVCLVNRDGGIYGHMCKGGKKCQVH